MLRVKHEAVVLIELGEAEARLVARVQLLRILEERQESSNQSVDARHDADGDFAPPARGTPRGGREAHERRDSYREEDTGQHKYVIPPFVVPRGLGVERRET